MRGQPHYSGGMVARLIAWMNAARRGRAPMALLALIAGFALAVGGGPAEAVAHAGDVRAAAQADAAGAVGLTEAPATPPAKGPLIVHLACAGHCAAHFADLPKPPDGVVAGRVEAADWSPAPPAPPYRANPEGLERPPRV